MIAMCILLAALITDPGDDPPTVDSYIWVPAGFCAQYLYDPIVFPGCVTTPSTEPCRCTILFRCASNMKTCGPRVPGAYGEPVWEVFVRQIPCGFEHGQCANNKDEIGGMCEGERECYKVGPGAASSTIVSDFAIDPAWPCAC